MRVFRLVTGPELSQTVSATDFLYKNKYVNPNSMVQKVLEKYPMQPAMPTKHPDPMTDPQMDRNFKFVCEMKAGDRELLWRSYMHAMSKSIEKRIKWRREEETKLQRIADHQATEGEVDQIRFRLAKTWLQRFHMEKVFEHLKLNSMDAFKKLMHKFYVHADAREKLQLRLFLKEHGLDPKSFPPPIEYERMTGKDVDLIRDKIALEHHELLSVADMRKKIAEQLAALAYTQTQETHQQLLRYDERVWNLHKGLLVRPPEGMKQRLKKV